MIIILIATDFSKASRNATSYGVQLAKEINANVILFNAYEMPTPAAGVNVRIFPYSVKTLVDQKLKEELRAIKLHKLPPPQTMCDEGNAEIGIINIANEKKVDFIIIGMKGSGKNFRKVFGSTATSLAKKTNIPAIIVPEKAKFKMPRNIAFASDISMGSDEEVPEDLKKISQLFKSNLNIVNVVKDTGEESINKSKVSKKSSKVIYTFDTSFEHAVDSNLRHALNDFIEKHHCDMLVMMPHKHEWAERLFKKSQTKRMIFHTKIPLMILPEISSMHMSKE